MKYAEQIKAEGKIKHIGLSSHNPEVADAAVRSGKIEVLLFAINPWLLISAEPAVHFRGTWNAVCLE